MAIRTPKPGGDVRAYPVFHHDGKKLIVRDSIAEDNEHSSGSMRHISVPQKEKTKVKKRYLKLSDDEFDLAKSGKRRGF